MRQVIFFSRFLVLVVMFFTGELSAQPQSLWLHHYDAGGAENFYDIYAVHDSSYIAVGSTGNRLYEGGQWLAVKVDREGETIWSHTYGDYRMGAAARTVIEADNGDFLAAGNDAGGGRVEVMRINSDGEQIWRIQYLEGFSRAIIELKSGDFLICGESDFQGFLLLINGDGDEL